MESSCWYGLSVERFLLNIGTGTGTKSRICRICRYGEIGWIGYRDGWMDVWMDGWEYYGPSSASAPPSQLRMCKLNAIFTILVRLCGGEKKGGRVYKFQGQLLIWVEFLRGSTLRSGWGEREIQKWYRRLSKSRRHARQTNASLSTYTGAHLDNASFSFSFVQFFKDDWPSVNAVDLIDIMRKFC